MQATTVAAQTDPPTVPEIEPSRLVQQIRASLTNQTASPSDERRPLGASDAHLAPDHRSMAAAKIITKRTESRRELQKGQKLVEPRRIELLTFSLRTRRSPS